MARNIQISEFLVDKYKNLSYLKKRKFFIFIFLFFGVIEILGFHLK